MEEKEESNEFTRIARESSQDDTINTRTWDMGSKNNASSPGSAYVLDLHG